MVELKDPNPQPRPERLSRLQSVYGRIERENQSSPQSVEDRFNRSMVELKVLSGEFYAWYENRLQSVYGRIESVVLKAEFVLECRLQSVYGRIESPDRAGNTAS